MTAGATAANLGWLGASAPAWWRFRRALAHPEVAQAAVLHRQLAAGRDSAYGRHHGFDAVCNYEGFRRRVPIVTYDDLAPWIQRVAQGEPAVLTAERVTRLVPTSGSTAARKLIPFTAGLQREFNAAIGPWVMDLVRQHPGIIGGPAYWSVSPAVQVSGPEGTTVPVGFDDDAAYLGRARQRFVDAVMAVPSCVRDIDDMTVFRRIVLLYLLRCADLRLISVWHPSFLLLLLDALPAWWDELLADIDAGGFTNAGKLPVALRTCVGALEARPARAAELRRATPDRLEKIWPRLRVVSCWGDGNARLALTEVERRFPHASVQAKGLLATEAFVTLPFEQAYPVAVTAHFFEFIAETGEVLRAHELRADTSYEVVVTTSGGLWRYRTGDRVEVMGFVERTPSLRFLGRAGCVSDLRGEKLSDAFVADALGRSLGSTASIRFALLAPEELLPGQWAYTLFVEGSSSADLGQRLEIALRDNPHYAYCRDLGQLQPLRVLEVPANAYARFAAAEQARGLKLGDIKPVALSLRTDWRAHLG